MSEPKSGGSKQSPEPRDGLLRLSRRTFLELLATSSAFALPGVAGCNCSSNEPGGGGAPTLTPSFTTTLRRRDDLLFLRFDFFNFAPSNDGTKLERQGSDPAYMVVTHAPQHVYEETLFDVNPPFIPPPPVRARLSGESRVAFSIPDDTKEIDYTPDALLGGCSSWELSVSVNALPPQTQRIAIPSGFSIVPVSPVMVAPSFNGARANSATSTALNSAVAASRTAQGSASLARSSGIATTPVTVDPSLTALVTGLKPTIPKEPTNIETSLELPFRLFVSPNHYAQFAHAPAPVSSSSGRTELWHTRLGVRTDGKVADETAKTASLRTMRALWTREPNFDPQNPCTYQDPTDPSLFASSLSSQDRIAIVHESSNFAPTDCVTKQPASVKPEPISVNRLMLTALGGYLDSKGNWGDKALYGVASWTHRAGLGRDHYVELHYTGVLYPFGHSADLVKITERKFHPSAPHIAYLWQRQFILVREPVKSYAADLRQFPFTEVHLKTIVTPDLNPFPTDFTTPFVPNVDNAPFRFHMEGLDRAGNLIRFEVGVVWVPTAGGQTTVGDVSTARGAYTGDMTIADLRGQRVAYAVSSQPDDTTYETQSMTFAEPGAGPSLPKELGYLPGITQASLQVEALRHLAGQAAGSAFKYAKAFLDNEFGTNNEGELLMELVSGTVPVDFQRDSSKSGGFIAPSMDVGALSRMVGPVAGDLGKAALNTFDPTTFLSGVKAKLFGVFNLSDVIKSVLPADGGLLSAPKFITQALNQVEEFLQDLTAIQAQATAAVAELESLGETADTSITQVATDAAKIVTDIAAIRLDEAHIEGDIDQVTLTDLPAFTSSVNAAAALFGQNPLPPALQKLSAGPRAALKQRLDQLVSVVASASSTLHDAIKAFRTGEEIAKNLTVKLDWRPSIQGFPTGAEIFAPNKPDALLLAVELRGKDSPGKPAGVDLLAALEDFEIRLIAPATFMILKFKRVAFSVTSGKKPDIDVEFDDLVFDGVLAFVDELRKLIPLAGFSDPPNLDVSTEGIKANFSLALPNTTMGVFSLTNLNFSAGFHIPFIGNPLSVSFQFSKRESPFHLTVNCIGGGGFFGIEVSPGGVILLEAAFEFGAELSLDLGVASGAVSVMAGIYFKWESNDALLTGYFRIHGEVEVLGLITTSITLYMELSYEFSSQKLVGRASLEIEISIAFFSISVSISVERKFSGSSSDPTFEDVMKPELGYDPFADYVSAFNFAA